MLRDGILLEVGEERDRQDAKYGKERYHHPLEWLCILGEEVGEVNRAVCEKHFNTGISCWSDYRAELIQVAAVAVAMVESLDLYGTARIQNGGMS